MLSNLRRIAVGLILAVLALSLRPSAGLFQNKQVQAADGAQAGTIKRAGQKPSASTGETSAEERLVRDVYARLMRYQSAAADELAAEGSKETAPDEYLTFELRGIHSGPIAEIYDRPLDEMVTPGSGEVVSVKPTRLSGGDGVAHTYYEAQWATATDAVEKSGASRTKGVGAQTVGQWLRRGGKQSAGVTRYTSYEVTAQLQGQRRSYRALILYRLKGNEPWSDYRTEAERLSKLAGIEVVDNITPGMNAVLTDESPRVRVPWAKYVKSSLYLAVEREIGEAKESGRPLIPADAPIGYLPGDNAAPSKRDVQRLTANAVCPGLRILRDGSQDITDTTQSVVVGERINLSLEVTPEGDEPSDIQWTVGGNRVANYVVNSTGPTGPPTALTNLGSPDLTFYWVSTGQEIEVSVTATIFGTVLTRTAHFNVAAPGDATPTVALPTSGHLNVNTLTGCANNSGGPHLVFGNVSGPAPGCSGATTGQAGIIFTPPTTSTPPGSFFFVQIVTGDHVTYTGPNSTLNCTGTPGLDGGFPYPFNNVHTATDAPQSPLPTIYTNSGRDFAATMYLMWQSNTTGSIPVPMGSINWGFSGSTTQSNGMWSAPSGSGSAQPFAAASGVGSFPTWNGAVTSATGNCH